MESPSVTDIECPLRSAARECPNDPALIAPDRTITFRELDAMVAASAAELSEIGSSRLAFVLEKGWPYVTVLLAAIRAGLVAIPLSSRQPPAAIETMREHVGAGALISDRRDLQSSIDPGEVISSRSTATTEAICGLDDPATMVFTSGSTGRPKAVVHTFGNHYFSAEGSNQNIALGPGDRWLLSLPLYHVGGLAILFRCLIGRAAVYIPGADTPLHEAATRVTHASMVATQLRRVLEAGADLDLRAILLGGSAIPDQLIDEAHRRGLPIHTSYGLTEMASQVATTPPNASLSTLKTSGFVLPHRELRIEPDGEILVRGRTRFAGYAEGAELTKPFDAGGWYATGDLGEIDGVGLLRIRGRKDNMFISGGENITPEEIEAAMRAIPGVQDAVVVPVEDKEWGHRPVAFVRMTSAEPDPDALRAELAESLPRFMLPIAFHALPEEKFGFKADRQALRRRAEELR